MSRAKVLGRAELEIMEAVWPSPGAVSVREVHDRLYPGKEKAYTTVQTIMNILVDKGALKKEKVGMVNFYTSVMTRAQATHTETHSLVSRLFGGSFGELAAYLVDSGQLTPAELDALRARIAHRAGDKGGT